MLSDKISSLPDHTCPSHKSSSDVSPRNLLCYMPEQETSGPHFSRENKLVLLCVFTVLLVVFLMALDPKDYSFIESGEV